MKEESKNKSVTWEFRKEFSLNTKIGTKNWKISSL